MYAFMFNFLFLSNQAFSAFIRIKSVFELSESNWIKELQVNDSFFTIAELIDFLCDAAFAFLLIGQRQQRSHGAACSNPITASTVCRPPIRRNGISIRLPVSAKRSRLADAAETATTSRRSISVDWCAATARHRWRFRPRWRRPPRVPAAVLVRRSNAPTYSAVLADT